MDAPALLLPVTIEPGLELPCPLCATPVTVIPEAIDPETGAAYRGPLVLSHHDLAPPNPATQPDYMRFVVWHGLAVSCPMSGQAVKVRR